MIFGFVVIVIINTPITAESNFKTKMFLLRFLAKLINKHLIFKGIFQQQRRTIINYFNHDFTF